MFKLIKWLIILAIILFIWLSYDIYQEMTPIDKSLVKEELKESLDTGETNKIKENFQSRFKKAFDNKQEQLKRNIKDQIKKWLD